MSNPQPITHAEYPFLSGGGQMGELIRSTDWAATTLGSPGNWPVALKQSVSMMLKNNFPMSLNNADCADSYYIFNINHDL